MHNFFAFPLLIFSFDSLTLERATYESVAASRQPQIEASEASPSASCWLNCLSDSHGRFVSRHRSPLRAQNRSVCGGRVPTLRSQATNHPTVSTSHLLAKDRTVLSARSSSEHLVSIERTQGRTPDGGSLHLGILSEVSRQQCANRLAVQTNPYHGSQDEGIGRLFGEMVDDSSTERRLCDSEDGNCQIGIRRMARNGRSALDVTLDTPQNTVEVGVKTRLFRFRYRRGRIFIRWRR